MEKVSQVLPSDLFGCFKWPFQGLSDLHLGDQKDTWKKLEVNFHKSLVLNLQTCDLTSMIFFAIYFPTIAPPISSKKCFGVIHQIRSNSYFSLPLGVGTSRWALKPYRATLPKTNMAPKSGGFQ